MSPIPRTISQGTATLFIKIDAADSIPFVLAYQSWRPPPQGAQGARRLRPGQGAPLLRHRGGDPDQQRQRQAGFNYRGTNWAHETDTRSNSDLLTRKRLLFFPFLMQALIGITGWLRLEGISGGHLAQPSCSSRAT
ncbi:uncharacterized protein M6G45_016380 [Spheniscus humboldti]